MQFIMRLKEKMRGERGALVDSMLLVLLRLGARNARQRIYVAEKLQGL